MYKNAKKISISICVWAGIQMIFLLPAVVCWGITFDTATYEKMTDPLMYRMTYLFVALISTFPSVMFWIKFVQSMTLVRINSLLEADADGFVPIKDLAKSMGRTEPGMIKKINRMIRKGYLINCNYSMTQKAVLLSDKIGKPDTQFRGMPENLPFVGVSCPSCAAALKIRANTKGTCPFCGTEIMAPYNAPVIK